MIIDLSNMKLERPADDVDFTDLTTTSGAVKSGPARWVEGQPEQYEIPFTPEAAESERWPITRRIITKDANEEALYRQAEDARTSNIAWRTNTSPQITTDAQTVENDSSFTTTERDAYIRGLAKAVRVLNTQLAAVSRQNEEITVLLLRVLNKV